jgi:hypothetical protein
MKEVQFAGGILLIGSCKMRSILPLPLKLVTSCCQSQLVQCNLIFRQGGIPFDATEKTCCGSHLAVNHMPSVCLWHVGPTTLTLAYEGFKFKPVAYKGFSFREVKYSIMCINFLSRIWLSCFPCVTCVFNLNFCNYVCSCTQIRLCYVTCFLKAWYALMKYYSCLCILLLMNSFLS